MAEMPWAIPGTENKPREMLSLAKVLWPDVTFYSKQVEIIRSVEENAETFVPAGNMLGKDFVAGFIILAFFLTRTPCRIITTSADYSQLESVLWGEVRRFINSSAYPLRHTEGGPLVVNHLHLRKLLKVGKAGTNRGGVSRLTDAQRKARRRPGDRGKAPNVAAADGRIRMCGVSYALGRVAAKGEGLLGHHVAETGDGIPRTLFIADEASGVDDVAYDRADTWASRKLIIGNPYPCDNFFRKGVEGGDLMAPPRKLALVTGGWDTESRAAVPAEEADPQPDHIVG